MKCKRCGINSVKNGKVKTTGQQRFYCKHCKWSFLENYTRKSYEHDLNDRLVVLIKESCGIRSISRILGISPGTVISRIKKIASEIQKPMIVKGKTYEMDELITYIGRKDKRICIAYAMDRQWKGVIDFNVGRRNKGTLRKVINSMLLSDCKEIRTDKLNLYPGLIPEKLHVVKQRGINNIERMNLTLRTHIKCLNRRTIAYSKSLIMLSSILKIYFWG